MASTTRSTTDQQPPQLQLETPAGDGCGRGRFEDGLPEDKTLLSDTNTPFSIATSNRDDLASDENTGDEAACMLGLTPESLFGRPRILQGGNDDEARTSPVPACVLNIVTSTEVDDRQKFGQPRPRSGAEATLVKKLDQCNHPSASGRRLSPKFHGPNRCHILGGEATTSEIEAIQLSSEEATKKGESPKRPLIQML